MSTPLSQSIVSKKRIVRSPKLRIDSTEESEDSPLLAFPLANLISSMKLLFLALSLASLARAFVPSYQANKATTLNSKSIVFEDESIASYFG